MCPANLPLRAILQGIKWLVPIRSLHFLSKVLYLTVGHSWVRPRDDVLRVVRSTSLLSDKGRIGSGLVWTHAVVGAAWTGNSNLWVCVESLDCDFICCSRLIIVCGHRRTWHIVGTSRAACVLPFDFVNKIRYFGFHIEWVISVELIYNFEVSLQQFLDSFPEEIEYEFFLDACW